MNPRGTKDALIDNNKIRSPIKIKASLSHWQSCFISHYMTRLTDRDRSLQLPQDMTQFSKMDLMRCQNY